MRNLEKKSRCDERLQKPVFKGVRALQLPAALISRIVDHYNVSPNVLRI